MALDATAIAALATALKDAKIACGAVDNAALTALCTAEATAIATFVKKAEVDTTGGLLISAAPGSPVTGTAAIK